MRILVTGAAGFIGSHVATALARLGHDVVAADAFLHASYINLLGFTGDVLTLRDYDDLRSIDAAGPFDVVVHQSAITGMLHADGSPVRDTQLVLRSNVELFRALLQRAVPWKASVVWASSCSIYGRGPVPMREDQPPDPLNAYAYSKLLKERLATRFAPSLPGIVGLRYTNVYGPGEAHKGKLASMVQQLALQMRQGQRPRIFTDGSQRRDFVYIDDVVQANVKAIELARHSDRKAHVFNVGAGASWSFNELVRQLNAALGTDLPPQYFDNPYGFTQDHTEADLTRARVELGYTPHFDLTAGIRAYAESGELGMAEQVPRPPYTFRGRVELPRRDA
ncbi:MAG: NAD-dependent epimerase/dehydratase family protein [Tepidisphaerales bacterium]